MANMIKIVGVLATLLACITAEAAVEFLPGAIPAVPVAPAVSFAPGVITARSQQYFARNYNALTAPIIAPAPLVAPVQPVVARAPLAVAPYASSVQYSQFTQFAPNLAVPVAPVVGATPVAARPVEPVQPVIPDDVVEIESARLRQTPVNYPKERNNAPQKLVQATGKSARLAAAPALAASAPIAVPAAAPLIRNGLGVPYYL